MRFLILLLMTPIMIIAGIRTYSTESDLMKRTKEAKKAFETEYENEQTQIMKSPQSAEEFNDLITQYQLRKDD